MTKSNAQNSVANSRAVTSVVAPELLAPAGNFLCAKAAVENGADAIYFGLQSGFNARARADNITFEQLPELMEMLHRRGVKGYTTLNTLAFTDELPRMEEAIRKIAEAGVDAILVQDFGVAVLAGSICPDLEIHASTQMTLTNAQAIEQAKSLGVKRAVLPRELSLKEIERIAGDTDMPLEVFVHGALCVAYSGQCLTSESLGGRSANRGMCAQACRLPYEMLVDGKHRELGEVRYLLSPQDLAAYELIPDLIRLGVASLKIEGRLKTPEYVANIVRHYRNAIDQAVAGNPVNITKEDQLEMELSFSRGFSPGWLEGNDHKRLVPGLSSAKKGVLAGKLLKANSNSLFVKTDTKLAPGDGIVLQGDRVAGKEFGGRIFEIFKAGKKIACGCDGEMELRFERGLISAAERKGCEFFPNQLLWKTDDPKLNKRLRKTFQSSRPIWEMPIDLKLVIKTGQSIQLEAKAKDLEFQLGSEFVPEKANRHPIGLEVLKQQFSRLGGTGFRLGKLSAEIDGQPMVPLSVLGKLRKELVRRLIEQLTKIPDRQVYAENQVGTLLAKSKGSVKEKPVAEGPGIRVLCRSMKQVETVLNCGIKKVIAEFHDVRKYRDAAELVKGQGGELEVASLRIQKPGETGLLKSLGRSGADRILARNLSCAMFAKEKGIPFTVDFSLNVANSISAAWWHQFGADRVTPCFDLNRDQMIELAEQADTSRLEVVIHQHIPMFHMEHCVFCSVISPGTNKHNCGRPCDDHVVQLVDRVGAEHHLRADIGCRNTLYNAKAQSGAETASHLVDLGVNSFRIELLNDLGDNEVKKIIDLYQKLLKGKIQGKEVWTKLNADNRIGVTRGTLEQPRNPLNIL